MSFKDKHMHIKDFSLLIFKAALVIKVTLSLLGTKLCRKFFKNNLFVNFKNIWMLRFDICFTRRVNTCNDTTRKENLVSG